MGFHFDAGAFGKSRDFEMVLRKLRDMQALVGYQSLCSIRRPFPAIRKTRENGFDR